MRRYFLLLIGVMLIFQSKSQNLSIPKPKSLKAELVRAQGKYKVQLSWDKHLPGDTLTESYYVFNNFPPDKTLYLNGEINRLNGNNYLYEVKKPYASRYFFAVKAVASYPYQYESPLSDTVSVLVPSTKLPLVQIKSAYLSDQEIEVIWHYEEILDLREFQLLVNGEVTSLDPDLRKYILDVAGLNTKKFVVQMRAKTESGIESDLSRKVFVVGED